MTYYLPAEIPLIAGCGFGATRSAADSADVSDESECGGSQLLNPQHREPRRDLVAQLVSRKFALTTGTAPTHWLTKYECLLEFELNKKTLPGGALC